MVETAKTNNIFFIRVTLLMIYAAKVHILFDISMGIIPKTA
jgi:hypothetical protein